MNNKDTQSLGKEPEEVPSSLGLDSAFNWITNVVEKQNDRLDALDVKAATLFAVATSTIGLGLGISLSTQKIQLIELFTSAFGWLVFIFYGLITVISVISLWVRSHSTLSDTIDIRKYSGDVSREQFEFEMLAHLEEAFSRNKKKLVLKRWATRLLVPMVALEALFIVLSLGLAH